MLFCCVEYHERPYKFFQGGQPRHFAYLVQIADQQTDVHKKPFYTKKKIPILRQQS